MPQWLIWRVEYLIIAGLIECFRWLPLRWTMRLASALFAFFGPWTTRAEKARQNLRVAFPEAGAERIDRLVRASFRHLGFAVADMAHLGQIWRERDRRIEFVLEPGAVAPSPQHRTVFVTAHLGAWQLTPLIGPFYGVTMPVIYAPENNPYVDRKVARLRRTFSGPLVSRDGGIRVLMRALDAGQSIGLTVDTRMDAGEPIPFFGNDAPTNTAPARLALRYDCDMVPVLAERLPKGRYRVRVYPAIRPSDASIDSVARARDMTLQLNRLFERWIRAMPGQWLCMKRRWPKSVHQRLSSR